VNSKEKTSLLRGKKQRDMKLWGTRFEEEKELFNHGIPQTPLT
jgi:hypothetical protein